MTYTYDGDGDRVKKSNGKLYWYGVGIDPLSESDASGNLTNEYIFLNGSRIAMLQLSSSTVNYYVADHLGSSRIVTNSSGAVLDDFDFYPYGGERSYTASSGNNYKFTGKERDTESGLDDFAARFYTSNYGRFLSPDDTKYVKAVDPQTWNLYGYVANNPINAVDPTGHSPEGSNGRPKYMYAEGSDNVGLNETEQAEATYGDTVEATIEDDQQHEEEVEQQAQQQTQQQAQRQPQYDPTKTGPEDPTNPGHPLFENPTVKKEIDDAFVLTGNGTARRGLAEAGFTVEYKDGKISIGNRANNVHQDDEDGKASELFVKTDNNTIAIVHTHGNNALPTPSLVNAQGKGDVTSKYPNFVKSRMDLYVTIPGTTNWIHLLPAQK